MEAWVLILLIFIVIIIAVGIILLVYFIEKKKETPTPDPIPDPDPVGPSGPFRNLTPVGQSGASGPFRNLTPVSSTTPRFKAELGLCVGTGTQWNIGGRSDTDCAQACITNSPPNATIPAGWTKCTGWDEINNEGAFSCILYDYPDIRGSGTNSGACNVLTS